MFPHFHKHLGALATNIGEILRLAPRPAPPAAVGGSVLRGRAGHSRRLPVRSAEEAVLPGRASGPGSRRRPMNPLDSIWGTIISGVVLALILTAIF